MTAVGLGLFALSWILLYFIGSKNLHPSTYNWADHVGVVLFFISVFLMFCGVLKFLWEVMP